jgi:hypothetical protein
MFPADIDIVIGANDQDATAPQFVGQELQQQQRWRAGPVKIIKNEY